MIMIKKSIMSHFVGVVLLAICMTGMLDGFEFDKSYGERTIYANSTKDEDIIPFRYMIGNEDQDKTNIKCGYIDSEPKLIVLVIKEGKKSPRDVNPSGNRVAGRASVYVDPKQVDVIGIKLTDIRRTDPTKWRCEGIFLIPGPGSVTDSKNSDIKELVVLDPPTFADCLNSLKQVNEGEALRLTCLVSGKPKPFLKCEILDYKGNVMPGQTIPGNIGANSNGLQENITTTNGIFRNVQKEASTVRCRAYDSLTGVIYKTRNIIVLHKPFKPKNFTQVASPNPYSIRIRWKHLLKNETGEDLDGYKVSWFVEGRIESQNKTVKDLPPTPNNPPYYIIDDNDRDYYLYTIPNLGRNVQYRVWIQAFNNKGLGDPTERRLFVAGIDPQKSQNEGGSSDDNLAAIIGGVIAGVVFIILIVILIVWLSRRSSPSKSKYPTSYIEDAIEYPPSQPQNGLYANVNKNGHDQYSNGGGDSKGDYAMRPTPSAYEPSDKAFV